MSSASNVSSSRTVCASAAPVAEDDDEHERGDPRHRRVDVDVLQQRPPADGELSAGM